MATKLELADVDTGGFWTSGKCLAMALQSCVFCYGLGLRPGRAGHATPCHCVFRAIFRACYAKFRVCTDKEKHISRVSMEGRGCAAGGRNGKGSTWGMKFEEYCADFCLTSRRVLAKDEHRLFVCHFLMAAEWPLCCSKLGINRGAFFHETYRIQQKLGRVFAELTPHALFPTDAYFASTPGNAKATPTSTPAGRGSQMEPEVVSTKLKAMAA